MMLSARPISLAVCLPIVFSAAVAVAGRGQPTARSAAQAKLAQVAPMARVLWLEPIADVQAGRGQLPTYRAIGPSDPRVKEYTRFIDTEAARFARRLLYRATRRFGHDPIFNEPVLPIVVQKGGNNAAFGLAIQKADGVEAHPTLAYVILDPSPKYLGDTILHETGHVLHSLAAGGRRGGSPWSAFPHTTFAISDPMTALAEGYGIHMETLWGHYGNDRAKRAYYHRSSPQFVSGKGRDAEYFAPVDDLMNFAQVWARYQAVRDALPAFEGHVYPAAYARTQMDPERDRSRLKTPNGMLASEGVAASVMFWISAALAEEQGAKPAGGLDQPALVDAEMVLLEGLSALPAPNPGMRPDLIDLVEQLAGRDAHVRDIALARFIDVTRGVTARPAIRAKWEALYESAIMLDLADAKSRIVQMDAERSEILEAARQDPRSLREGVGPVIPVRAAATFELKALGRNLPVEFDLNAMSVAEMALLPKLDGAAAATIARERTRAPFASAADFATRCAMTIEQIGLSPVDVGDRGR